MTADWKPLQQTIKPDDERSNAKAAAITAQKKLDIQKNKFLGDLKKDLSDIMNAVGFTQILYVDKEDFFQKLSNQSTSKGTPPAPLIPKLFDRSQERSNTVQKTDPTF